MISPSSGPGSSRDFSRSSEFTGSNGAGEVRMKRCCAAIQEAARTQAAMRAEVMRAILERPHMKAHEAAARIALVKAHKDQLEIEREINNCA